MAGNNNDDNKRYITALRYSQIEQLTERNICVVLNLPQFNYAIWWDVLLQKKSFGYSFFSFVAECIGLCFISAIKSAKWKNEKEPRCLAHKTISLVLRENSKCESNARMCKRMEGKWEARSVSFTEIFRSQSNCENSHTQIFLNSDSMTGRRRHINI